MLLAIEQGNTNTLFAVHDGADWIAQWRGATDARRTADEYAVWLFQLMTMHKLDRETVDAVIISSVVPQSLFHLRNLSRRYLDVEPMVVSEGVSAGVDVRIDRPEEAGADRLVSARGARELYGTNLFIVDSGTATTIDVLDHDGAFCGGIIAPGINLSLQALHDAAAKLPKIAIQRPPQTVGKNTVHAMQSGIFWGYVSLIDGLIDRMGRESGSPTKVIATGGVASLFEGASERIDIYDPDLLLTGLYAIWQDTMDNN
jgi:type III pantothenate kinase